MYYPPLQILKEMKTGCRNNVRLGGKNVQMFWGIADVSLWGWREKRAVLLSYKHRFVPELNAAQLPAYTCPTITDKAKVCRCHINSLATQIDH